MTVYDDQLASHSRAPQTILLLGLTSCCNWYAQIARADSLRSDDFSHVTGWVRPAGTTITANTTVAPDGTTTADTIAFAGVGDYIRNGVSDFLAASNAFTESVWLKTAAGSGTITLEARDGGDTEGNTVVVNVTTTWTRFSWHKLFSGGAGGGVMWRMRRDTTDLASVIAWRANTTENPGNADKVILWPGVQTDGATVNASSCAATDAGNGSRCYYSFPTCQDPMHFNTGNSYEATAALQGFKEIRLSLKDGPLPIGGEDIWPMLKSVDFVPQKIDPERSVTVNERVKASFYDDAATWNWNQDKAGEGAKTNTTTPPGTFWRRFMRIYRNYSNPRNYATVKVGFVASGMTEAIYSQRGKFLLINIAIGGDGMVTMTLSDKLRLTKRTASGTSQAKAPAKIGETNLINGAINSAVTSVVVDDASEVTEPGSDYNVCLQLTYDGTDEFVNVTARNLTTNTLTIQRGRWGTAAASHADNARFREVLQFGTEHSTPSNAPLGKNPIDIVIEILRRAGIAAADIDSTTLNSERDTWLVGSVTADVETGILFKRCGDTVGAGNGAIADQSDLEELLKQIREIVLLNLWVSEASQVTGRVFAPARPSVTLTEITDNENILRNTVSVDDNEESRLTRVVVGYDLLAGEAGSDLAGYQKIHVRVGADEEATGSYGDKRTKVILCPWLRVTDTATINKLTAHIISRFRNPARRVNFDLELKDDGIECGDFVNLTTAHVQTASGASDGPRIMEVLSKQRNDDGTLSFELLDTGIIRRYWFIAPAGQPDYDSATAAQKRYAYIGTATQNLVGTLKESGYFFW